jgi:four helix bundle protein
MGQHFKELVVWQKAMEMATEVYKLTDGFPKREVYSLTDQIRRAAVSVPSNIAEGQAHHNNREFVHFCATRQARWLSLKPNCISPKV